ncbi:hypothetical protein PVT67_04815 [Gallaecimonas kandeliae]|uniref:hypothetical protein n=1 Tax=Gallaecimonas kandeliae TaxID=3029055 RepID=UPI002648D9B0|nr:hypothetical protein [Gallaecimonas kandeliae]WKE66575.1 hypothetical protein PVT67_04815 [Gallaecimonas kandeliae]
MDNLEVLRSLCRKDSLSVESVKAIVKKNTNIDIEVIGKTIGSKQGFDFTLRNERFFVTERKIAYYNKKYGTTLKLQERMLNVSIPIFFYIGEGTLDKEIHTINNSENPLESSNEWLSKNFSPEIAATYLNKYFSKSSCLAEYKDIIFEAVEAYYLSMPHIAIMSLLPVFEAGLRNLQHKINGSGLSNVSSENFEKGINSILFNWGEKVLSEYNHYPGKGYDGQVLSDFLIHVNPQCDVISSFKLFFSKVLYKPSDEEGNGFNRHMIIHLLRNDFNSPPNFVRLFLAITHITFIDGLYSDGLSIFWPGPDSDDHALGRYFRTLELKVGIPRKNLLANLGYGSAHVVA